MKSIKTIQDLAPEHISQLAHLLSLPPGTPPQEPWLRNQVQHILTLPSTLRKRPSIISHLTRSRFLPQDKAYLCAAHRSLNAYLIRHIFLLVSAECTARLARLVENLLLPTPIKDFVRRLHGVNALWMAPGLYHLAFGALPTGGARRERITSGCEACILAAVGGDVGILSDLRASLIGRKKRSCPTEGLLPLVEAWIMGTARGEEVFAKSDELGNEVLRCRREMQKARREEKRSAAGGDVNRETVSENTMSISIDSGEADLDEHDFEGSIINFYANILPSPSLVLGSDPAEDIHPAFRNSIYFAPTAGASHRHNIERLRRSFHTVYSDSIYSTSSGFADLSPNHDTTLESKEREL